MYMCVFVMKRNTNVLYTYHNMVQLTIQIQYFPLSFWIMRDSKRLIIVLKSLF